MKSRPTLKSPTTSNAEEVLDRVTMTLSRLGFLDGPKFDQRDREEEFNMWNSMMTYYERLGYE